MSDTAGWLQSLGIGGPVAWEDTGLLARRQAEADERAAERAEAERQARLAEANDARQVAFYMNGVQPGAAGNGAGRPGSGNGRAAGPAGEAPAAP